MKKFGTAIVAFGAIATVVAQESSDADTTATPTGPVIQLPWVGGVDPQTLVGSVVAVEAQVTTVVVTCPEGTSGDECGFNPPVTVTAGPSTFRFALPEIQDAVEYTQDCSINSESAVCTVTGQDNEGDPSATGSIVTTTETVAASEVVPVPITITAGDTAALTGDASPSSSGSSNSGATTTSPNSGRMLVPDTFGAALLGFAALWL